MYKPLPKYMTNGSLRRNNIVGMSEIEFDISNTLKKLQKLDSHPNLTEAETLLSQAKDKIADYLEQE